MFLKEGGTQLSSLSLSLFHSRVISCLVSRLGLHATEVKLNARCASKRQTQRRLGIGTHADTRFDMPTDTQDHCSNLNGIHNGSIHNTRSSPASGVYFHVTVGKEAEIGARVIGSSSLNLTLTFRGEGEPVGRNGARNDGRPPLPTQITYAPCLSQELNDSAPIFYRLWPPTGIVISPLSSRTEIFE